MRTSLAILCPMLLAPPVPIASLWLFDAGSQADVRWQTDLAAARTEALETQRPLFVVMRCLPCKQCSEFDQEVLEGGPELEPLLSRFVTVRLTDAADVDLTLFPMEGFQDLDLSWWGWLLAPDGELYGVYGGRDHVSDKTRISVKGLASTLTRVLDHHTATWKPGASERGPGTTPRDLPGYASWARQAPEVERDECLHCHQVAEILRQPAVDAGTFDKLADLEIWPFPENIGLALERDHGLLVTAVETDSPAATAGLRVGDVLSHAGERALFSEADLRAVLHRAERGATRISIGWSRDGRAHKGELELDAGWKRTILDWRMSVSQGNVGASPSFWPLNTTATERARFGVAAGAMAIKPWFGPQASGPAFEAGLRAGHLIVAVDGESPDLAGRAFLVWFRQRQAAGERVTLRVRGSDGSTRDIEYVP